MNQKLFLVSLVVLVLLGLVGCAKTSKAPVESSDTAKSFETVDDKGVVFLYRRGRAVGAAVATQIKINGNDAGGTGPGTFFRWELKPGTYVFSASTEESSAAVEVVVEAGQLYFVEQNQRIGLSSGRVQIDIRDESTGMAAVQGLKLLVSTYIPD